MFNIIVHKECSKPDTTSINVKFLDEQIRNAILEESLSEVVEITRNGRFIYVRGSDNIEYPWTRIDVE